MSRAAHRARMGAAGAATGGPGPGPDPDPTTSTIIGVHPQRVSDARNQANDDTIYRSTNGVSYTDLDMYEPSGTQAALQTFVDDEFKGYAGGLPAGTPLFGIGSQYNSVAQGFNYQGLAQRCLELYGRVHLIVQQSAWSQMINPTAQVVDNIITGIIEPLTTDQECYVAYENEPALDLGGSKGTASQYRQAFARFAQVILSNRGSKKVWPCTAYTANSITNLSTGAVLADARANWDVMPELDALGVDPDQVHMFQHGYCNPNSILFSQRFEPVFAELERWGFTNLSMGEGGTKSRRLINYNRADTWLADFEDYLLGRSNPLKFVIYYHSGGSGDIAENDGWWWPGNWTGTVPDGGQPNQTGDTNHTTTDQYRRQFAQIARRFNHGF